jgi:hypothetical protein
MLIQWLSGSELGKGGKKNKQRRRNWIHPLFAPFLHFQLNPAPSKVSSISPRIIGATVVVSERFVFF